MAGPAGGGSQKSEVRSQKSERCRCVYRTRGAAVAAAGAAF